MKARVVFSNVGWVGGDGRRNSASNGKVVDLPLEEFDRLAALGAVTRFAGGGQPQVDPAVDIPHPAVVRKRASVKQAGNRASPKK